MKRPVLHQLQTNGVPLDGMCYVLECDDGSTVVFDGGMDNGDAETLLAYLKELNGGEKPVIDLWILTHAHPDHTFACKGMGERHSDEVTVKKIMFRFPSLEFKKKRDPGTVRECEILDCAIANFQGVEIVTPSTGDCFQFGSVKMEVLFTCADLPPLSQEPVQGTNDTSTVVRVTCEGQTILFLGDVEEAADRVMIDRYGKDLKCDVCQIAHHGSFSSTREFYSYLQPEILLWPVRADRQEKQLRIVPASRYLMESGKIKDVFLAGHGTVALELPVTPRETPFLPEVPFVPDKEKVGRISATYALKPFSKALSLADEAWGQAEFSPLLGLMKNGQAPDIEYKLLWDEKYLYFAVRVHKSAIPNPMQISSLVTDSVRIYFTENAVTDPFLSWKELKKTPGDYFDNVKFYPDEKQLAGFFSKVSDPAIGECDSVCEDGCYTLFCRILWHQKHQKGDVFGFNVEVNGIPELGKERNFTRHLVSPEDGVNHFGYPYSLAFVSLD